MTEKWKFNGSGLWRVIALFVFMAAICNLPVSAQTDNTDSTMKQKMLGLRTFGMIVPDLEVAKKWYAKAFDTKPYFDEPFYVGFNIGGYELGLMPEGDEKRQTGNNIITYWGVDDIRAMYDYLLECGAQAHEAPHNVGGPIEVASVKDPWGNIFGIIYNPVFKAE